MALFEREETDFGSDVGTRALSVIAVENHFVERVYEKLASVYDLIFGPTLHPGRLVARDRMEIRPGSHILEVGVGTGINASLYPRNCHITGIDLSTSMLDKARERVAREGLRHVRLMEMDAAETTFGDDTFDIVYAPYLISVVPDPVKVACEMRRVCKPGGKIVILNHFRSANPVLSRVERALSPFTVHIGFKSDLDLPAFLAQAELRPESIEKVNVPMK
jgi:phosphatidylethanolamine/phosphatidyl-N-methylethanolamine N-methyltransferase